MKRSVFFLLLLTAVIGGVFGGLGVLWAKSDGEPQELSGRVPLTTASRTTAVIAGNYPDFTYAAENSVEAVVHVANMQKRPQAISLYEYFFGYRRPPQELQPYIAGMGSGVILTTDGYIVTNNHVIENANALQVTLYDKRTFPARLVGTDPVTDVAVLKIEAEGLPYLPFGNSDSLRLGEWVLAIGNPYNLNSTITAGIVSAKGRHMPMSDGRYRIESFIQTDAAVNPGNSGGALVNLKGELVGINTAIASPTGSFSGYSFAVPTGIVRKVVEDIIQSGSVQRAALGVVMTDVTDAIAKQLNLKTLNGVLITQTVADGAAAKAGIREGDVITHINNVAVNSTTAVQEQIARYRPDQQIEVQGERDGNVKYFNVVLSNINSLR